MGRSRVRKPVQESSRVDPNRLFVGVFPTGISYADKERERDGDYMRVAFLPFSTLELEWSPGRHPPGLRDLIERDAASIIRRRGQPYQVSGAGQTVTLGYATKKSPAQLEREVVAALQQSPDGSRDIDVQVGMKRGEKNITAPSQNMYQPYGHYVAERVNASGRTYYVPVDSHSGQSWGRRCDTREQAETLILEAGFRVIPGPR